MKTCFAIILMLLLVVHGQGLYGQVPDKVAAWAEAKGGTAYYLTDKKEIAVNVIVATDKLNDVDLKILSSFDNLRELDLYGGYKLTDTSMKELSGLKIRKLTMPSDISDAGLKHVGKIDSLEVLWLSPAITDQGIRTLSGLKNLKKVRLAHTKMTDACWKELANIKSLEEIEFYPFNDPVKVTGRGILALKTCKKLKVLNLHSAMISDASVAELSQLQSLEQLNLYGSPITDASAKHLAILTKLTDLWLRETKITDLSMQTICTLDQLKILDLNATQITDESLKHLKGLQKLEHLFIGETKITKSGIKELSEALPKTSIHK